MFESLTNTTLLADMQEDFVIFKSKYAEAVRAGLLTEHQVWQRWLV